jgi:hypothetical protein
VRVGPDDDWGVVEEAADTVTADADPVDGALDPEVVD